jgi:hypothetical protein
MNLSSSRKTLVLVVLITAFCWWLAKRSSFGPLAGLFVETEQIERIRAAKDPADRERQIAKLEAMPEKIHSFHSRWLNIYGIDPGECWSDDGYDPSRSSVPRDIQILAATVYGTADIENGGFHQFFSNSTGVFAPEMVEFYERSKNPEAAAEIRKAMAFFGGKFPRSQKERQRIIAEYKGDAQEALDPSTPAEGKPAAEETTGDDGWKMNELGDRWLREVCGIKDLRTPCPVVSNPPPAKP